MGRFKPLLSLGECTVIEQIIGIFRSNRIENILVVVGHQKQELIPLLARLSVTAVENPDFQQGMFSSIVSGVKRLSPETDAFFIMPGDMPLVEAKTVEHLMNCYEKNTGRILRPVHDGRKGHPPLIPASFSRTILNDKGDGGLREILNQHQDRIIEIEVSDPNILMDMDWPEDFNLVLKKRK
jgi:CTP:molybdopterin cytidylyltransferase MocA